MRATIRPYEMALFKTKVDALTAYCAEKAWDMDKLTSVVCASDLQMLIADAATCLVDTGDRAGVLEAFYSKGEGTVFKKESEGTERRSFVVKPGSYIVAIDENGGTYTCLSNTIDDLFTYGRSIETQLLMKMPARSRRVVLWLLSTLVECSRSSVACMDFYIHDVVYALRDFYVLSCDVLALPPVCKKA